ncbi:MAG: transglycosylase domain-containing protein [Catonella sp.]|jgi:penicillin-binding protein 1A|nr:transglycosylase domain-containing protein [Catonella sp.]MDY6357221.1 transglycosylase domain-containing protein [Catonella sp.]
MNYGKEKVIARRRRYRSIPTKISSKAAVWLVRLLLVFIVAFFVCGAYAVYGAAKGILDRSPDINSINVVPTGFQTTIYNVKGKKMNTVVGAGANRVYKTLDQIPDCVQKAFIAIEDERFYEHGGIDVRGIFRAGLTILASGGDNAQGASTITQQLLKNQVFEGGEESTTLAKVERKIQEQYLAIKLEGIYSKDQILEYYLNTINLGQNTLGVQTASQRYFGKDVSELTISEAAVIAGITKNPTANNPITNPETNAARRNEILKKMLEQGYISEDEYNEAMADDVYARIQAVNTDITNSSSNVYSYYVDATIEQVVNDLVAKKGYSTTQAYNLLNSGGLSIYTYQDPTIQSICNKTVKDETYYANVPERWQLTYALSVKDKDGKTTNYSEGHIKQMFGLEDMLFTEKKDAKPYIDKFKAKVVGPDDEILGEKATYTIEPQVSVTVMDPTTGAVVAIVGGRGKKAGNLTLNRATDSTRQPGSLFKVLSTYLPALDMHGDTLASVQDDGVYYYPNSDKEVHNWWGDSYEGLSTYRRGIYRSMNIVTVKTLEDVGLQPALAYLDSLGFTTITEDDANLALALGGLSLGVSNLEVTAAYSAIANQGIYTSPSFYSKVLDHDGNVILENKPVVRQVMKDSTSFLLTDAMHDVLTASGATGTRAALADTAMGQAAKTGSSTEYNDIWISGFTPYYTCTVWAGYDNNKNQSNFSQYHLPIWKNIMDQIIVKKKLKDASFVRPSSITTATICTKCGKLAVSGLCDKAEGGSCAKKEYFAKGSVPTETCTCHVKVKICKASGKIATKYCPEDQVSEKVYLVKEEKIVQKDSKGKEVVRTYKTKDTPYIISGDAKNDTCKVHDAETAAESEVPEEATSPDDALPNDYSDDGTGTTVNAENTDGQ